MAKYKLRYFFDAGSGVCLWSANDAAREKYDYPVDVKDLPIDQNTRFRAYYVLAWYNTCLDWNDPGHGASPWDEDECKLFDTQAQRLLGMLREDLGEDFELVDESGTAR